VLFRSARAHAVEQTLTQAASGQLEVVQVERKQRKRHPAPPFTTSTLQQEAARKLGFGASRTMRLAQQLYEGVDIGTGAVGLISYMRTDSVHLAQEAVAEIRAFVAERYGPAQLPPTPREYKTKAKNAQEAHEAIRPTSVARTPQELEAYLNRDQLRLYELIWKRSVACQMIHATINTVAVDLACGAGNLFRATGSTVAEPGFMQVYLEGKDDAVVGDDDERLLPAMAEGERVDLLGIRPEQHFTEPPPRYTEASLVRALEEMGIGRPSTYASIITTLQDREYVRLEQKRFYPSDVGRVVNRFLTEHFTQYVDYDFTARLEDELDAVSRGEEEWVPLLVRFWRTFKDRVDHTQAHVKRSDVTHEALDEQCPKCGNPLSIRLGRHGRFIGCTHYPQCDYTRDLENSTRPEREPPQQVEGRSCPQCGAALQVRQGRYGKFIGCSAYPDCTYIEPLEKPQDTGVTCPQCGKGSLVKRKSRRGKIFYSCSTYPSCDYALWNEPVAGPCPRCSWPILSLRVGRGGEVDKVCPQKGCSFSERQDGGEAAPPGEAADAPAAPTPPRRARRASSTKS
jgi:DNA topoisomerase-1